MEGPEQRAGDALFFRKGFLWSEVREVFADDFRETKARRVVVEMINLGFVARDAGPLVVFLSFLFNGFIALLVRGIGGAELFGGGAGRSGGFGGEGMLGGEEVFVLVVFAGIDDYVVVFIVVVEIVVEVVFVELELEPELGRVCGEVRLVGGGGRLVGIQRRVGCLVGGRHWGRRLAWAHGVGERGDGRVAFVVV